MSQASFLWLLLGVAAVAAWSLFRPARQLATVGSLELWQEAVDRLGRRERSRSRRVTLAWLLLLAGALSAVGAAARPAVHSSAPARRLAIGLYPSAEIASEQGMLALRQAAEALLARLGPDDRVQWLAPAWSAASAEWLSVSDARRRLADLRPLPVPARDLSLAGPDRDVQHVYRIAPAGAGLPLASGETLIEVPTALPDVTVDALSAAVLPDGNVQVFLAMRGRTGKPWQGRWRLTAATAEGNSALQGETPPLAAGERGSVVVTVPPGRYLAAEVRGRDGSRPSYAFLARREASRAKVAFVGPDNPMIRRFLRVSPELILTAKPADADILVCIAQEPPAGAASRGAGKPALVVRPPSPPPGATADAALENLVLSEAGATPDSRDPVMANVDLSAVAIRRVEPWRLEAGGGLKALCAVKGAALLARTTPELSGDADAAKRVYVAFALDTENTNFAATESFVAFLANAFRWLAPRRLGEARYEFLTPSQAPAREDWTLVTPVEEEGTLPYSRGGNRVASPLSASPLAASPPGVYRDSLGDFHAVGLVGLRPAEPAVDALRAVAAAPLPGPRPTGTTRQLWPWLALAAMALWLAGWSARMR